MFSANISGVVKRVLFDNEKDAEKAMVKIVVEAKKQFVKKDEIPYNYPVVAIFGHDAAYFRDYAGKGHYVECVNCDLDVYRGEDGDEEERISFKCGKLNLLPKSLADQIEVEDDDDEDSGKKKKKGKKDKNKGKSRSERRKGKGRDEDDDDDDDDDDEDEDERPSKKKGKKDDKKSKGKGKSKKSRDDDDDDDEDFDDDDDDFYDDDED